MTDGATDRAPGGSPDGEPAPAAATPDPAARRDRVRRAVRVVLVALLVAAVCGAAGVWQWSRHTDRSRTAERVEANYEAPPRPLADVLDSTAGLPAEAEWSPAAVRARYLAGEPVTLRNRPVRGVPAVRLLHPVEITEGAWAGRVLVVDRGWVTTADGGPERRPTAPQGTTDLVVRLRPAETRDVSVSYDGAGRAQVRSIVPGAVLDAAPVPDGGSTAGTLAVYGLVVTEDGAPPAGVEALPPPDTSLGNNLSYAFQWWVFGVGALAGAVVLVRRDRREDAEALETEGSMPAAARPRRPGGRRRPTAEEEEDALLDGALEDRVSRGSA